jgi:DNA-binding MarR family transcriptional regulator
MSAPDLQIIQALLDEAAALTKDIRQTIVVSGLPVAATESKVIQLLDEHGHLSVPQLGRLRKTSRQNIQVVINRLLDEGWVELTDNPAHKRSPLVRLTAMGKALPPQTRAAEGEVLKKLAGFFDLEEVRVATALLSELRKQLQEAPRKAPSRGRPQKEIERPVLVEEEIPLSLL